jgi:hypothetical protein
MGLKTAYNDQTKETVVLVGDSWQKADQVAKNDSGKSAYLVGGKWLTDGEELSHAVPAAVQRPQAKPLPEPNVSMNPMNPMIRGSGSQALPAVASVASGIPASLAGGLNVMAGVMEGKVSPDEIRNRFQGAQQALTYQPRTEEGRKVAEGIGEGLRSLGPAEITYGADKLFEATGSPLAGAAAEGIGNAALMFGPGALNRRGKAASPQTPASAGLKASPLPEFTPEQTAAAEAFAKKAGIDWSSAATTFKDKLLKIAQTAGGLEKLDPKAAARVARAEKIKAPITRGQATRDLVQITDEENIRRTKAGEEVRKKSAQQDTALHDELTRIREGVSGKATPKDAGDVGSSLQGAARRKMQILKAQASVLYKEAEAAGEMKAPVNVAPLEAFLKEPVNARNMPWLEKAINDYKTAKPGVENAPSEVTLKNLEDLRAEVAAAAGESGRKGFVGGKALRVIDDILDKVNSQVYSKARGKWREMKEEFAQQGSVRDLTSEKAGTTDRRIALEDTLGRVIRGSNESLTQIKNTLTRGGTAGTRQRGARAWKDLQAGVLEHLREIAAGKRKIQGEDSQLQFNSSFLDELAKLEQGGKLETLFGKQVAGAVRELGETVRDLRTTPADRVVGPQTALRIFRMIESFTKLPLVNTIAEAVNKQRTVKRANTNPVTDAVKKSPAEPKRGRGLSRAAPVILAPQTYGDQG